VGIPLLADNLDMEFHLKIQIKKIRIHFNLKWLSIKNLFNLQPIVHTDNLETAPQNSLEFPAHTSARQSVEGFILIQYGKSDPQ
jgi:hypothetical protein